ncbi:MAG: hypothetical protein D6748_14210, partial [Calditrichaeota bacterium]
IREALNISSQYGDRVWKGYNAVPFVILLVTDSTQFLIHHPNPSPDFKLSGVDDNLNTEVYYRKRQFSPHLLATFPAVNGLSCIVVGTPENTGKNSTEWIITLLHEHFHQYQQAYPDYYESVNQLELANGDQTGMWMLNYPFPYDSARIIEQYHAYTRALHQAVTSPDKNAFEENVQQYFAERKKLKEQLAAPDYRYFSFQIWQEGLARYTEYKFLELLEDYVPSKEVTRLPDFKPFDSLKTKMYRQEIKKLLEYKLNEEKRRCFYSAGFAEGLLLDKLNKNWRERYLTEKFYVERYFDRY